MKKILVLLTICSVISLANPASANDDHPMKPTNILLIHASLVPAYFLWMTTLHEGSHALVLVASGARVTSFKPYPHMHTFVCNKTKRFLWGSVTIKKMAHRPTTMGNSGFNRANG